MGWWWGAVIDYVVTPTLSWVEVGLWHKVWQIHLLLRQHLYLHWPSYTPFSSKCRNIIGTPNQCFGLKYLIFFFRQRCELRVCEIKNKKLRMRNIKQMVSAHEQSARSDMENMNIEEESIDVVFGSKSEHVSSSVEMEVLYHKDHIEELVQNSSQEQVINEESDSAELENTSNEESQVKFKKLYPCPNCGKKSLQRGHIHWPTAKQSHCGSVLCVALLSSKGGMWSAIRKSVESTVSYQWKL